MNNIVCLIINAYLLLFIFQFIHSNNRFEVLYQYLKVEKYSLVDTYAVKKNLMIVERMKLDVLEAVITRK